MNTHSASKASWSYPLKGSFIYPLLGPLLGYGLFMIGLGVWTMFNYGVAALSADVLLHVPRVVILALFGYLIGGFQALIVGVAVLLQIRRHGRSDLRLNLTAAAVANVFPIIIALAELDAAGPWISAMLLGISLATTYLLHPLERKLLRAAGSG